MTTTATITTMRTVTVMIGGDDTKIYPTVLVYCVKCVRIFDRA